MPPTTPQTISRNSITVPIAIIIAGAMIAAAIFFGGSRDENLAGNTPDDFEAEIEPVTSADHILGSPNAELIVVEYSDLECPFCKVFHSTMHKIVEDYGGKVAWVYRHYPIKQLHSRALKEAEASECAADQGGNAMFWKYIDEVFSTTQANNTLDPAMLPTIASELGLDVKQFNECLSSGKYAKQIEEDVQEAVKAGARGTPYSIIIKDDEQIPINGAEPYEDVKAKIDSLL
jgi:protein-disulfide isomerase